MPANSSCPKLGSFALALIFSGVLLIFPIFRYQIAQSVAYEDIALSTESLQRFLAVPDCTHRHVQASLKHLSIEARNFDREDLYFLTSSLYGAEHIHVSQVRKKRSYQICGGLIALAGCLPSTLASFRIKIIMRNLPYNWNKRLEYTALTTIIRSLPKNIKSLTIDHPVGNSDNDTDEANNYHSICSRLLQPHRAPSLRHLCVRLHGICPDFFKISHEHETLETLIINVCLDDREISYSMIEQSIFCSAYNGPQDRDIFSEMLYAAWESTVYLPRVKVFRILHAEADKLISHNILTDKLAIIPKDVSWDDKDWVGDEYTELDSNVPEDYEYSDGESVDTESLDNFSQGDLGIDVGAE